MKLRRAATLTEPAGIEKPVGVYITDMDLELIQYIERFHASMGIAPTDAQLNQRFELPKGALDQFKTNPLVLKSFKIRGIIYPSPEDAFTPEQMHAAAVMTDLIDRRSDEKKLRDLGITSRQWATWIQDDNFAQYLKDRSEKMLANSTHEVHKGLMKGVRNGNVASVKMAYEITGRYRPDQEQQIDIRFVLHSFIEVIQRYIRDPVVLHKIAMDMSAIATTESYATGLTNQMMHGAQTIQGQSMTVPQISNFPTPPPMKGLDDGA
jgi:hypothetical protein